jgi:hypothetical protein
MLQNSSTIMQRVFFFQICYSYVSEIFCWVVKVQFYILHTADDGTEPLFSTLSVYDPTSYVTNYWYDVKYS